jgi:hypothetical protein
VSRLFGYLMPTLVLVCSMIVLAVNTGESVHTIVHVVKIVHHHSTRPLYRHILKPVGSTVAKTVKP